MKLSKIIIPTFLIILAFSVPFLLDWEHFRFSKDIDATRFGQYGDYIGGLLGATFAGMGFLILALSYRTQINSSRSSEEHQSMQLINSLYESVTFEINNVTYQQWQGSEVFYKFSINSLDEPQNVLDQLNSVLNSMQHLIKAAKNSIYPSDDMKRLTLSRVYMLCYSKILWPVNARIMAPNSKISERLKQWHDDFPYYSKRFDDLEKETFEYLAKEGLTAPKKQ
jgi:hypothetical protein